MLWSRVLKSIMYISVLFLLAACSGETDLTLKTRERWEARSKIYLSPNEETLYGGRLAIQDQLIQNQDRFAAQGANLKFSRAESDGRITYELIASGQGWDDLAALSDNGVQVATQDGRTLVQIRGGIMPTTVRLHGARIHQNDADEIEGSTAIWYSSNPRSSMNAFIDPVSAN